MTTLPTRSHWLAEPALHQSLSAVLRRKVPHADVEDLAQTTLCEALEAERLPDEPGELKKFVLGIARHKAADHHRRAFRSPVMLAEAADPVAPSLGNEVEARALLGRIAESVANDHREQETLDWIVREHEGEPLGEIARTEKVEAPAVRQRVSRLRRMLRARYAGVLVLLLGLGGLGYEASRARPEAILVDPAVDPAGHALGTAQGKWRVVKVMKAEGIDRDPYAVTVRIDGNRVELGGPFVGARGTIADLVPRSDGSFTFTVVDEKGGVTRGWAHPHGRSLDLQLYGRFSGTARLARD